MPNAYRRHQSLVIASRTQSIHANSLGAGRIPGIPTHFDDRLVQVAVCTHLRELRRGTIGTEIRCSMMDHQVSSLPNSLRPAQPKSEIGRMPYPWFIYEHETVLLWDGVQRDYLYLFKQAG